MKVIEVFDSIQGEGILTGTPSTFIRASGCNLRCKWCDTKYAWNDSDAFDFSFDAQDLRHHVVITGGEPLMQSEPLFQLCVQLRCRGHHITVETNGTMFESKLIHLVDLWSVSPKLGSSGEKPRVAALRAYQAMADHDSLQFKFVIGCERDLRETWDLLHEIEEFTSQIRVRGVVPVLRRDIVLQPVGNRGDPAEAYQWLLDLLDLKTFRIWYELPNLRVMPQMHVLIWGQRRGI